MAVTVVHSMVFQDNLARHLVWKPAPPKSSTVLPRSPSQPLAFRVEVLYLVCQRYIRSPDAEIIYAFHVIRLPLMSPLVDLWNYNHINFIPVLFIFHSLHQL